MLMSQNFYTNVSKIWKLCGAISSPVSDLSLWNLASLLIQGHLSSSVSEFSSTSLRWKVAKNLWKGLFLISFTGEILPETSPKWNKPEGCSFTFYYILQMCSVQVSANLLPSEIMKITTQEFLPGWHHSLGKTLWDLLSLMSLYLEQTQGSISCTE